MENGNGVEPPLDPVEVGGRLMELAELNSALTNRCAGMRGQLAQKEQALSRKDAEIARLTQELASYRQDQPKDSKSKSKDAVN